MFVMSGRPTHHPDAFLSESFRKPEVEGYISSPARPRFSPPATRRCRSSVRSCRAAPSASLACASNTWFKTDFYPFRQPVLPPNNPGNNSLLTLISYPAIALSSWVDETSLKTPIYQIQSGGRHHLFYLQHFTDLISVHSRFRGNGQIPGFSLLLQAVYWKPRAGESHRAMAAALCSADLSRPTSCGNRSSWLLCRPERSQGL